MTGRAYQRGRGGLISIINFPAPQSAWQKQLETKGEQKELRDKVAAVISGAARILPGSPQPVRRMGAFSNVVAWVGPVL